MRARSWMAALALIAATSIAVGRAMPASSLIPDDGPVRPQQPSPPRPRTEASGSKPSAKPGQAVMLNLEIAGLGSDGCDVEVKPANASCKFRAYSMTTERGKAVRGKEGPQHVSSEGHAVVELKDVDVSGADRVCALAITVLEPGQTPKTVYRGIRLSPRPEGGVASSAGTVPTFTCYLSSSSKVATAEQTRTRK